jgi:hypothetical protein
LAERLVAERFLVCLREDAARVEAFLSAAVALTVTATQRLTRRPVLVLIQVQRYVTLAGVVAGGVVVGGGVVAPGVVVAGGGVASGVGVAGGVVASGVGVAGGVVASGVGVAGGVEASTPSGGWPVRPAGARLAER